MGSDRAGQVVSRRRRILLTATLALAAVLLLGGPVAVSHAFWQDHHEKVTRDALPFIRPTLLNAVVTGDRSQDVSDSTSITHHFDDCRFTGSTRYIRLKYDDVVADVRADGRPKPLITAYEFGRLLHTAQDFYAHSNWTDLSRTDLLDPGLGPWRRLGDWDFLRDDLVVGQGEELPDGWSIAPNSGKVIPRLETPGGPRRAVITGYSRGPFDACHDDMSISHERLNKDHPGRAAFGLARQAAVRQTRHEWCRLLHVLKSRYGEAGPSALLGLGVRRDRAPHPPGTPCASRSGSDTWRVRVTSIRVKDIRDGDDDGEINLAAVLYQSDFRGSDRSQVGPLSVQRDAAVPARRLPEPLIVCSAASEPPIVTVQAGSAWRLRAQAASGRPAATRTDPSISWR